MPYCAIFAQNDMVLNFCFVDIVGPRQTLPCLRTNADREGRDQFKHSHTQYNITKTRLYNSDPLGPYFYIVKLGFIGVYIIFFISAQKHRLWYSLEPPRRGGSNEYPQSTF